MSLSRALSTNNFGPCKFIVSSSAATGTHTTLASAIAAASAGDTIFLRDSVTENVTLTPGVNIANWSGSSTSTPTITGKITMTGAGTSTISGIKVATNSDFAISITGSAASNLVFTNCFIAANNNTAIQFTSSSSSASLVLQSCQGNIATTGIALFSCSTAGALIIEEGIYGNSGLSTTANTFASTGALQMQFVANFQSTITTSGTSAISVNNCRINTAAINTVALTHGSTAAGSTAYHSVFESGSATAISVGASATLTTDFIGVASSNTNAIDGTGTIKYGAITYTSTSSKNNVTTQTPFPTQIASTVAYAPVCGGTTATGALQSVASAGSAGQVLTSNGSGALPSFQAAGGGTFVKQTRSSTSTAGSTTTAIPYDNTIPQNTEGAEVLTCAITPSNANNILLIEYTFMMTCASINGVMRQFVSALFQDSTANAIYAQLDLQTPSHVNGVNPNAGLTVTGRFYMTAGTTSATTFKLRVGPAVNTYTYYWLSDIGTDVFSTVNIATMTITEFTA